MAHAAQFLLVYALVYMRGKPQLECLPFMVCTLLTNGKTSYIQTRYNIISGTFSQPADAIGYFPIDLYLL